MNRGQWSRFLNLYPERLHHIGELCFATGIVFLQSMKDTIVQNILSYTTFAQQQIFYYQPCRDEVQLNLIVCTQSN